MTEEGLRTARNTGCRCRPSPDVWKKPWDCRKARPGTAPLALLGEWSEEYRGKVFSYLYARQE